MKQRIWIFFNIVDTIGIITIKFCRLTRCFAAPVLHILTVPCILIKHLKIFMFLERPFLFLHPHDPSAHVDLLKYFLLKLTIFVRHGIYKLNLDNIYRLLYFNNFNLQLALSTSPDKIGLLPAQPLSNFPKPWQVEYDVLSNRTRRAVVRYAPSIWESLQIAANAISGW